MPRIDPKQIKSGNVPSNLNFLGLISFPNLVNDSSSLDFLCISSNQIKKRTLGTLAFLNSSEYYSKSDIDTNFVTKNSVVTDIMSVTATNNNPVSAKMLLSFNDTIYRNMESGLNSKAASNHTHDYYSLTNRPSLFDGNYNNLYNKPDFSQFVLQNSVVTDIMNVTATNNNPVSAKMLLSFNDTIYRNMDAALNGKAASNHTHDYYSLTNRPSLFDGNYNNLYNKPSLFDGNYNSLTNKPSLFDGNYNSLTNKPSLFDGNYNNLTNKPSLFDGNYNNLTNKPSYWDLGNYFGYGTSSYGKFVSIDSGVNGRSGLFLSRMAGMSGFLAVNGYGEVILVN